MYKVIGGKTVKNDMYFQILKLSRKSLGLTADGQLANLLSNDCQRFDVVTFYLPYLFLMPFQILIVGYLVWLHVGISSLVGILFMILLTVPLQGGLKFKVANQSI